MEVDARNFNYETSNFGVSGLKYIENYITQYEHDSLLTQIYKASWIRDFLPLNRQLRFHLEFIFVLWYILSLKGLLLIRWRRLRRIDSLHHLLRYSISFLLILVPRCTDR